MEIMVVVSILGIMTTIAVLGFRKTISHQKIKGEISRVISALRYITDESRVSKKAATVYVDFDPGKASARRAIGGPSRGS